MALSSAATRDLWPRPSRARWRRATRRHRRPSHIRSRSRVTIALIRPIEELGQSIPAWAGRRSPQRRLADTQPAAGGPSHPCRAGSRQPRDVGDGQALPHPVRRRVRRAPGRQGRGPSGTRGRRRARRMPRSPGLPRLRSRRRGGRPGTRRRPRVAGSASALRCCRRT